MKARFLVSFCHFAALTLLYSDIFGFRFLTTNEPSIFAHPIPDAQRAISGRQDQDFDCDGPLAKFGVWLFAFFQG